MTVSKASSTREDVESNLATVGDTLRLIHAVPSTSIEGWEYGERREIVMDKDNFDRNESKQKSTRMMKVKCIHCNENTCVKENGIKNENTFVKQYENGNEFKMIEKDSKDEWEYERLVWMKVNFMFIFHMPIIYQIHTYQ